MSIFNKFGVNFSELRVLLVEDSEFALNLEKLALREMGFQAVVVARDGQEAYETLQNFETIDLVVSDWNMPNLNGLELLKVARQRWPGIPFVMLTINDTIEHLAEARKNGVDAYVVKPFSLEGLRDKIISAFRKRLALGGDKVDESDTAYFDVINRIEILTEDGGGGQNQPINKPLAQFEGAVKRVLFSAEGREQHMRDFLEKAKSIQGRDGKDSKLIEAIVAQLGGFIQSIEQPNPIQLEIVKLHVEAVQAVLSGRLDGASEIDGATLLKGLRMAAAKAGG